MRVKYIRVSTADQNTGRQEDKSFDKLYIDKISGATAFISRPAAKRLIDDIGAGLITSVTVHAIDRLGRSLLDVLTVIQYFESMNIPLTVGELGCSMNEKGEEQPVFKLMVSVLGTVAEMERKLIQERIKEGIAHAKAEGKYKGRKKGTVLNREQLQEKYKKELKKIKEYPKMSLRDLAGLTGVSYVTVQRLKKMFE